MTTLDRQLLALVAGSLVVGIGLAFAIPLPDPVAPVVPVAPGASIAPSAEPSAPVVEVDEELSVAARAYGHIGDVLDRDGFLLRSIRCWREADYQLCAICSTGPRHELGATLVKCDHWRCYWPLDGSEYERLGWNGEEECVIRDEEE